MIGDRQRIRGLTVASAAAFYLGGMTAFDAVCHAFSAVATGGFSTHDASAGHYASSSFILLAMTFFMLAGGTSFALLHRALTQNLAWRDSPELRAYLGIFAVAGLLVAWNLRAEMPEQFASFPEALQHALFQTAAILTTTGLTSYDFDTWPFLSHALLFSLFFVGGMAGSTAGGVKVVRSPEEAAAFAGSLLGKPLVTHQTGAEGRVVRQVFVEQGCDIERELYLGIVVDRASGRVALMASSEGGVEI